jgi:hypothetical protein
MLQTRRRPHLLRSFVVLLAAAAGLRVGMAAPAFTPLPANAFAAAASPSAPLGSIAHATFAVG